MKKQHDLYVNNLVGDIKANPRDFYRHIKSKERRPRYLTSKEEKWQRFGGIRVGVGAPQGLFTQFFFSRLKFLINETTDFDIVNFPFLDGDVPRSTSYGVYISQFIRFARVSSDVDDFNTRNKVLTAKLLRQGYRYHKLSKAFSKFYRRHFDLVSKYNVGLKTLLLNL